MNMKCPNCGAVLTNNQTNNTFFCEFCGYTQTQIPAQAPTQAQPQIQAQSAANYNLIIVNNSTTDTNSAISYSIIDAGINGQVEKGQSQTFLLTPGEHKIFLQVGQSCNTYTVVIVENAPVQITYNLGRPFQITQPYAGEQYKNLKNGKQPGEYTALSIVALIMSLTVLLSLPAMIMAIVDISQAKSKGNKPNGLDITALILGLMLFPFTMLIFSL